MLDNIANFIRLSSHVHFIFDSEWASVVWVESMIENQILQHDDELIFVIGWTYETVQGYEFQQYIKLVAVFIWLFHLSENDFDLFIFNEHFLFFLLPIKKITVFEKTAIHSLFV